MATFGVTFRGKIVKSGFTSEDRASRFLVTFRKGVDTGERGQVGIRRLPDPTPIPPSGGFQVTTIDRGGGRTPQTLSVVKTFGTREEAEIFIESERREFADRDTPVGIRQTPSQEQEAAFQRFQGRQVTGPAPKGRRTTRSPEEEARVKQKAASLALKNIREGRAHASKKTIARLKAQEKTQKQFVEERTLRQLREGTTQTQFVPKEKAETSQERVGRLTTKIELKKVREERARGFRTTVSVGPGLTESTLDLKPSGAVVGFKTKGDERQKDQFTPSGLISPASKKLRFGTFISPEQQKQFEKEGIAGKAKSFVSGGVGIAKTGVEFFRPKLPKTEQELEAGRLRLKTFVSKRPREQLRSAETGLLLFGAGLQQTVRERPFALAGQIAVTELGFRGIQKARVAAIKRQPTSVRLATRGEILTTPSPTKAGAKVSVIKPVEFAAEIGGARIAGIGEGRAVTTTAGELAAGFEFKIGTVKKPTGVTRIAVKGRFEQTARGVKGASISEIVTRTKGKVIKEKAITLSEAKKVGGGEFPSFATGALEVRKGKFKVTPVGETEIAFGRVAQPEFARAGIVRKEAEISLPVGVKRGFQGGEATFISEPVTVEKFGFIEKGVSAKLAGKVLEERKAGFGIPFTERFLKGLEARRILRGKDKKVRVSGVTDIGGLVPPVQVAIPKKRVRIKPEGIVAQEFLQGVRKAVKAERIASVSRIRAGGLSVATKTGVSAIVKPIAATRPIQRQIPKIEAGIISQLKPAVKAIPKVEQEAGIISTLKPTLRVAQATGQRVVAKPLLRQVARIAPTPIPTGLPVTTAGAAFVFPLPKPREEKKKRGRFTLQFGRKFRGVPSLSTVLGATRFQILTPGQIKGEAISPLALRALPKRK